MKRTLLALIISLALIPVGIQAQSYDVLWKNVEAAKKQDLPRKQMNALLQIVRKAKAEKNHGQLLQAELRHAAVLTEVAPDSLETVVKQFENEAEETAKTDEVMSAVYYSVLGKIYKDNRMLGEDHADISRGYYRRSLANPKLLAASTVDKIGTVVKRGADSRIFGNNMLSMLCMEAGDYKMLNEWYAATPDRTARMMSAFLMLKNNGNGWGTAFMASLDSLINIYQDIPECGELAVERFMKMSNGARFTVKDKMDYIEYALGKWGKTYDMNRLVNERNRLTQPEFHLSGTMNVAMPDKPYTMYVAGLRNIGMLKATISLLKGIDGTTELNPSRTADYNKLKALVVKGTSKTYVRKFEGHADYEVFSDSIVADAMKPGVYMVEMTTDRGSVKPCRALLYVTGLYVLQQQLPEKKMRYAVVNVATGQPVAGARLWIKSRNKGEVTVTCGADGEYMHSYGMAEPVAVRAYTATDKAYPRRDVWSTFSYYPNKYVRDYVSIYTDRAIYRPGQTVRVSAVAFSNKYALETSACAGKQMKLTLKDANRRTVGEVSVTTDEYGTASADFVLPATGLPGRFSVQTDFGVGGARYFRVEEYKRPTFTVEFDEVKDEYHNGDTLVVKGYARTYAGVPVQGATVSYEVNRSGALWWRAGYDNDDDGLLFEDTATTDADGAFEVRMPMLLPESCDDDDNSDVRPYCIPARFYTIKATADVTDVAGETHSGELALPIGSKPTYFDCIVPDKMLRDSMETITFVLKNAAGKDMDGTVVYHVDGSPVCMAKANAPVPVKTVGDKWLSSGRHTLTAICGNDTIEKKFVVFSLEDKTPCINTDEWFYVTSYTFPENGKPVYVQVGSSYEDVHVLYTMITGNTVIDSRVIKLSNSVETAMFKDGSDIEGGVLLNFAWVKNGVMHSRSITIRKPLPDKRLITKWVTFRDRLTPGQKEEWALNITRPDGTPARAQLMATLYDKSLDTFEPHRWEFATQIHRTTPYTRWAAPYNEGINLRGAGTLKALKTRTLAFNKFDEEYFMSSLMYGLKIMVRGVNTRLYGAKAESLKLDYSSDDAPVLNEVVTVAYGAEKKSAMTGSVAVEESAADTGDGGNIQDMEQNAPQPVQMRENLEETAFFYPSLMTDDGGNVNIRFTLPESVTTWRFMGFAHDKDMNNGMLYGETVARKDVMVQPNMPRFVRAGDKVVISARVFNTSGNSINGRVRLELIDPDTEKTVYTDETNIAVDAGATGHAAFSYSPDGTYTLLVCRITVEGRTFGDGEQHYLPVLPAVEPVTNTIPFMCKGAGETTLNIERLIPEGAKNVRMTVEYTDNPAWLAVQALPFVSRVNDDNAISLASAYYANGVGAYITGLSPRIKTVFEQWKREPAGKETSLMSALEKNSGLKTLVLEETPWVADAESEADRKRRISNFFDGAALQNRMETMLGSLRKLQNADGSWSWWKGMKGSSCMTMEVAELLVRLNVLTGRHQETSAMLTSAMKYLGNEAVKEVKEMKRMEKEGRRVSVNGYHSLHFLYINALSGRALSAKEKEASDYLMGYMRKGRNTQSLYEKALMAVVLAKGGKMQEAREYVQSLKEYTVATETMGRYYDTPRAGYSWMDYRIPTHVAAMEAIGMVTPDDIQTVDEMRLWLLQQKRTQDWGTPINSVNAIYALLNGNENVLGKGERAVLTVNGKTLDIPEEAAGTGYVKTTVSGDKARTLTAVKTSEGVSWGAVYGQFVQNTADIESLQSGLSVKREIIMEGKTPAADGDKAGGRLSVGSRVKVRITVKADRDYDFVQVVDKRAACLEPVQQLTGYGWGYYCTSKDYTTNFYFDRMSKGTHIIEKEYYVDREGSYGTGICTVQCAYAPEFVARDRAQTITVE